MQSPPVLTVSQLTFAIKGKLEALFPSLSLRGEISNFTKQASGHLYFSLKDAQSQISSVMFRGNASKLRRLPKEGDQVIVKGAINVYPPRGQYQLMVRELQFAGVGELLLQLEELKKKLQGLGWFEKSHKKPLPPHPRKIGIVTSPTGAVIQDMLNVLRRRQSGFHVILNPVKVQGQGAAQEIVQAITHFNRHQLVDVIIIGRGGGSIEDLWAFNEEIVAKAIFESKIPIISAVGHEVDYCLSDFVADLRAPTPSAAAEIVMKETLAYLERLNHIHKQLTQSIRHKIHSYHQQLSALSQQPVLKNPYTLLGPPMQKLDDLKNGLDRAISQRIDREKLRLTHSNKQLQLLNPLTQIRQIQTRVATYQNTLDQLWSKTLQQKKLSFHNITSQLKTLNPKNLLNKGYTILFSQKGKSAITNVSQLHTQETIEAHLVDGKVLLTVEQVIKSRKAQHV